MIQGTPPQLHATPHSEHSVLFHPSTFIAPTFHSSGLDIIFLSPLLNSPFSKRMLTNKLSGTQL